MGIEKAYSNDTAQVIAQHDGGRSTDIYFYLHDRLGSVRQVIDSDGLVVSCYTYDPWGLAVGDESQEGIFNLYRFAGYIWDAESSLYYCNARQYDPVLARFTIRDRSSENSESRCPIYNPPRRD